MLIEESARAHKSTLMRISYKSLPYSSKYFKALPALEAQNNIKKMYLTKDYVEHIKSKQTPPSLPLQKRKMNVCISVPNSPNYVVTKFVPNSYRRRTSQVKKLSSQRLAVLIILLILLYLPAP